MVAATVLLISVAVFFWTKSIRNRNQVEELRSATRQLYWEHVPDGPATSLIARAMRTKLDQARQWQAAGDVFDSTARLLDSVGRLLRSVPDDSSVKLDSIDILPGSIRLEGAVDEIELLIAFREHLAENGLVASSRELRKSFQLDLEVKMEGESGR